MDSRTTASSSETTAKVLLRKTIRVMAGMELATFTLLALFVLTWFATLEQTVIGLKPMMDKYFDWKEPFFFPVIGRPFQAGTDALDPIKIYFPMISGFWLCVIFTLNLIMGGIIRFRKTRKKLGILITHLSIAFLMISAGVTHFMEDRGALQIYEGEVSDVAQDYHAQVIEVSKLEGGEVTEVTLIDWEVLKDLVDGESQRLFRLKEFPFDLKVNRLEENAQVLPGRFSPPTAGQKMVDGYWLRELPRQKETEAHLAGAEISILDKNGELLMDEILAARSLAPTTVSVDGRDYLLRLRKKLWPLPFKIQLDDFRVERDPGTTRAAAFESDVTRISETDREEVLIQMNEPMRRDGWTFFQAGWGPQEEAEPAEYYSVLEVVRNPADQWPLYSLGIAMLGLFWQFGSKLYFFISKSRRPKTA